MTKTVEWKVENKEGGRFYLTERESGGTTWQDVRKRGLFGNSNKDKFQSLLDAYQQKLLAAGVTVDSVEWP